MQQLKHSKGSIVLDSREGRLRLRLPRALFNGKQTYLSLGIEDTKLNRKLAEQKKRQIELDILSNNFDFTLAKYKPQTHLAVVKASHLSKKILPSCGKNTVTLKNLIVRLELGNTDM